MEVLDKVPGPSVLNGGVIINNGGHNTDEDSQSDSRNRRDRRSRSEVIQFKEILYNMTLSNISQRRSGGAVGLKNLDG